MLDIGFYPRNPINVFIREIPVSTKRIWPLNRPEENAERKRICRTWHRFFIIGAFVVRAISSRASQSLTTVHTFYFDIVNELLCTEVENEKQHTGENVKSEINPQLKILVRNVYWELEISLSLISDSICLTSSWKYYFSPLPCFSIWVLIRVL